MSNQSQKPFKWRHFQSDIILLCIRWYLRYSLSYRDLEEIMLERGLQVDHTTIYRWVQRYAPELERRCRPQMKTTSDSWKVDAHEMCNELSSSKEEDIQPLIDPATEQQSRSVPIIE